MTTTERINDKVDHVTNEVPPPVAVIPMTRTPRCGLCCWRPDCLQVGYNWKLALALICWFTFLRGMVSVGLNSVSASSFERRFRVESSQIGWFTSASKFALGSSTIIFSYYGDRTTNKPRLIALSAFLMVVGCFLMALPHFIMEPYRSQSQTVPPICYRDDAYRNSIFQNSNSSNLITSIDPTVECKHSTSYYFNILIAASIIIGVSTGIYVSIGIAFIDDFSTVAGSGFNLGISYLSNAIGSGVGFGVGSILMSVDVNVNMPWVPKQNPADPTFLGAWWLGYTICIALFATVAIGFLLFDDELPESARLKAEKLAKAQTHVSNIKVNLKGGSKLAQLFASFLRHILRVVANPVVIWLTIATILSTLSVGGVQPFLIKVMQAVYGVSEMMAGLTMGVLIVVGIALGTFLSGVMVRREEMGVRSMLLVSFVFTLLSVAFTFLLGLTCPPEKLAGITYDVTTSTYKSARYSFNSSDLELSCNAGCGCKYELYLPACNSPTSLEYFSPCYAGCEHFNHDASNNKTDFFSYNDCSCLKDSGYNSTSMKYGLCANSNCPRMFVALAGIFLMLFCGFFILVPVTEVIMRCVPLEERAFSLAFFEGLQCFLGAVPGPLMMGLVFDKSCLMRQPSLCTNKDGSSDVGACIAYDSFAVTWSLIGIMAGFAFLSAICYIIAFFSYKPPSGETLGEYFRNLSNWWRCRRRADGDKGQQVTPIESGHDGPCAITPSQSMQLNVVDQSNHKVEAKPAENVVNVTEDTTAAI